MPSSHGADEDEVASFSSSGSSNQSKRHKKDHVSSGDWAARSSAIRLQRVWRSKFKHMRTQHLAVEFLKPEAGVTTQHAREISFEALVAHLRDKPVIAVTKQCVQRLHTLCTLRHGSTPGALCPANVNVRVVLAGYMIAHRPTHVFESMGVLEQSLFESAGLMVNSLQRIAESVSVCGAFGSVPRDLTEGFTGALFEYLKRFKAWKVPDEVKLTCRIKHALVALGQAQRHLPPDEPETSRLKIEFRTQIERLRNKLRQIAGPAALAQFDETHCADIAPPSGGGGGGGAGGGVYAALPERVTNQQLAHELLLDPTFQLTSTGGCDMENPVYHRIRTSFHQAFWDSVAHDLVLDQPCYVRVLRVLSEIRDSISELAGNRESVAVFEAIDIDFIRQQVDLGVYGLESCVRLATAVVGIIQRIQAPGRDAEVRVLWQAMCDNMTAAAAVEDRGTKARVVCKLLEFMLDRVNTLRIDAANARLRLIAPVIRDHGIDYERGKFQEKLDDGSLTLDRTKAWICNAVVREIGARNVAREDLATGRAHAFSAVHYAAMISLVADGKLIRSETTPETLLFDVRRLSLMQRDFNRVVDGSTVLIIATHAIVGAGGSQSAEKRQVMADLASFIVVDPEQGVVVDIDSVIAGLGRRLDALGVLPDLSARAQLFRALAKGVTEDDPVRQLISSRIHSALFDHIRKVSLIADAPFIHAARPLVPHIEALARRIAGLADINRAVHTPTYNRLIASAVADEDAEQ